MPDKNGEVVALGTGPNGGPAIAIVDYEAKTVSFVEFNPTSKVARTQIKVLEVQDYKVAAG